jgi:hypothetical protein
MYESLKQHSKDFHLYVFAFDDRSYSLLKKLNLENVSVVSLKEFEDDELLKVKEDRTAVEYCWTCTPSIIKYCLKTYNLPSCTYLDADLYFFSNPAVLIEEMGDKSVLITEHRYTPEYDQSATSGIYCVQFMTFKNDDYGFTVLDWWRKACIAWCYARLEDGKFGDQKYLDDWPARFKGIHVLKNPGGGVAPWNVQQYDLTQKKCELVFYHFHNVKFLQNDKVDLGWYRLRKKDLATLYKPYLEHLIKIKEDLERIGEVYDYHGTSKIETGWRTRIKNIKIGLTRRLKRNFNIYRINYILGL